MRRDLIPREMGRTEMGTGFPNNDDDWYVVYW
jgi:hypothetical protein